MRIFISGGAGVIGTALVNKLFPGNQLFVGDLKPKPEDWPKEIQYWQGDLNLIDPKILQEFAPDHYYHLAATFERTEESPKFWKENYHHNIQLSHYLLEVLKECPRILFASSYLIYEPSALLSESSQVNPRNLCGMAKLLHEKELASQAKSAVSARIFRVYGKNSRDIISRWISALKRDETLEVYGREGSFDYIFAEDVAEGLIRLAASHHQGPVNLGTGRSRSISEVLSILKIHFPQLKIREVPSNMSLEVTRADITLLKTVTGWEPKYSLEEGVSKVLSIRDGSES